MKGTVIYARYSSERQNDQSIEGQLRICHQYAEQNGLTVLDTYIDRAMTGTNDQRAAFQQMLEDSGKPVPWDVVLVYAIDRFGRNSIEIALNKQKLKKNRKTLISATQRTSENIDGSKNLDGILLENMYIGLAEYYSAELSQKVKRGIHETRSKGLSTGGTMIFGYRTENRKVYADDFEAPFVQYIFQQYANGIDAKRIIADLTNRGALRKGKPFALNTFYAILRNKKYIGIAELSDGVYTDIYPPIVPKALFDEVQGILAKNKIGSKSVKVDYLLKGICYCGYCGKHIQAETGTARDGSVKHYYKCYSRKKLNACNKSILPKDALEKVIVDATVTAFSSPENIFAISEAAVEIHNKRMHDKSLLNILLREKAEIQKTIDNIMKAIEQGILTATTKRRMEEMEQRLAETEDKILLEEYKEQSRLTREEVAEYLTHGVRQNPRLMLNTLIQKIILFDDKMEIYFNYTPRPYPDDPSPDDNHRVFFSLSGSTFSRLGAPNKNKLI